tara:strand:+ start:272 stop:850 length:579 start_codon:yes stop_codon:yes gene_type:complete
MGLILNITKDDLDSIGGALDQEKPDLVITMQGQFLKIKLNARKTLDNNIQVYDHPYIDIILIPFKNKIITLPKKDKSTDSYYVQERYFNFLKQKGAIVIDSIRGGSIYGSLEAFYPVNKKVDALQILLLLTKRFIDQDNDRYQTHDEYMDDVDEMYLEPDDEDATEYGEVPQGEKKGTIDPNFKPYGILYRV